MESDFKARFLFIGIVCESSETDVPVIHAEGFTDPVHVGFAARYRVVVVAMRGGPVVVKGVGNRFRRLVTAKQVKSRQFGRSPRRLRLRAFRPPVRPSVR